MILCICVRWRISDQAVHADVCRKWQVGGTYYSPAAMVFSSNDGVPKLHHFDEEGAAAAAPRALTKDMVRVRGTVNFRRLMLWRHPDAPVDSGCAPRPVNLWSRYLVPMLGLKEPLHGTLVITNTCTTEHIDLHDYMWLNAALRKFDPQSPPFTLTSKPKVKAKTPVGQKKDVGRDPSGQPATVSDSNDADDDDDDDVCAALKLAKAERLAEMAARVDATRHWSPPTSCSTRVGVCGSLKCVHAERVVADSAPYVQARCSHCPVKLLPSPHRALPFGYPCCLFNAWTTRVRGGCSARAPVPPPWVLAQATTMCGGGWQYTLSDERVSRNAQRRGAHRQWHDAFPSRGHTEPFRQSGRRRTRGGRGR